MPSSYNVTARQFALRSAKDVPTEKIRLHPEAVPSFEVYLTVPLAASIPMSFADPLIAIKEQGRMMVFGSFETWRLFSHEPKLPVVCLRDKDIETIRTVAWNEVLQLSFGQISGVDGYARAAEAIRKVPEIHRKKVIPRDSDRAIAKLLGVAPCRLKKGDVE